MHDVRFETCVVGLLKLCALALSAQHIRPRKYVAYGADYPDKIYYCLGMFLGSFLNLLNSMEIRYLWVEGEEKCYKAAAKKDIYSILINLVLNFAALIWEAALYFGNAGTWR